MVFILFYRCLMADIRFHSILKFLLKHKVVFNNFRIGVEKTEGNWITLCCSASEDSISRADRII